MEPLPPTTPTSIEKATPDRTRRSGRDDPLGASMQGLDGDEFRLAPIAFHLARLLTELSLDLLKPLTNAGEATREAGQIIAVNSPWGGGKTSLLSLTELLARNPGNTAVNGEKLTKVDNRFMPPGYDFGQFRKDVKEIHNSRFTFGWFNAWKESGESELVLGLFDAIRDVTRGEPASAAQRFLRSIKRNPARIAKPLTKIASIWGVPEVDVESWGQTLEKDWESLKKELRTRRAWVVLVVDDVDRLPPDRIQVLIRALWWVRDLPYVHFVLLFDARRVQEALALSMFAGATNPHDGAAAFMEKIVQHVVDIPAPTSRDLLRHLEERLAEVDPSLGRSLLQGEPRHLFRGEPRWAAIQTRILRRLVKTPRTVKRLQLAVGQAWRVRRHFRLDLRDVVALEALRLLSPSTFAAVQKAVADAELGRAPNLREKDDLVRDAIEILLPRVCEEEGVPLESDEHIRERRGFGMVGLAECYLSATAPEFLSALYDVESFFHSEELFKHEVVRALKANQLTDLLFEVNDRISVTQADVALASEQARLKCILRTVQRELEPGERRRFDTATGAFLEEIET